jgi:hypothetical protein
MARAWKRIAWTLEVSCQTLDKIVTSAQAVGFLRNASDLSRLMPVGLSFNFAGPAYPRLRREHHGSFDLPCGVMRDVHRSIAVGTSQSRHCYASKWLTPGDSRVLAGAAGNDMRATIHFRLRFVEVARIEGRKDFVAVAVGQPDCRSASDL